MGLLGWFIGRVGSSTKVKHSSGGKTKHSGGG